MNIHTLFFAHYQDVVGSRELTVAMERGATVRDLAARLEQDYPRLGNLLAQGRVAVNEEFADADTVLPPGAEAAWMPPMSGG